MTRGIRTSEFWAVTLAGVADLMTDKLHIPVTAAAVATAAAGLYAVCRSLLKWAETRNPALASDLAKVKADAQAAVTKAQQVEDYVKAHPALTAEQQTLIAELQKVARRIDLPTKAAPPAPAAPPVTAAAGTASGAATQ